MTMPGFAEGVVTAKRRSTASVAQGRIHSYQGDQDILLMIFGRGPPLAFAVQKRPKKNLSPPNGA
jgi:hypothetical protein